jgi:ferredoxin
MSRRWHVTVARGTCVGSAVCTGIAPGRFTLDEQQQRSRPAHALMDPDEAVLDAAASCPVEAISVVDADTGEPIELD